MTLLRTSGAEKNTRWLAAAGSVAACLVVWYLLTEYFDVVPSLFFPSPTDLVETLLEVRGHLFHHSVVTLGRVVASFLIGSSIGCLTGLLMSRYSTIFGSLNPIIEALRPIPPVALIPFFILWFGIGTTGKVILAGLGCFMVMVIATIEAVRNVPSIYRNAAVSLGASSSYVYRTVVLPAIIPELIGSARVALALAFGLMIAAELMGAQAGLGFLIMVARRNLNTSTILLGIVIIGIEARLADQALASVAAWLTRWSERQGSE